MASIKIGDTCIIECEPNQKPYTIGQRIVIFDELNIGVAHVIVEMNYGLKAIGKVIKDRDAIVKHAMASNWWWMEEREGRKMRGGKPRLWYADNFYRYCYGLD